MTGPTRLVLCRHGEPEPSARGRFCGAIDVGLSDTGRAEADALAAGLAAAAPTALYSSPARRAVQTARPIGVGLGLDVVVAPGLREIDFGEVDGLTFAEVEASQPVLYDEWLRAPTRVRFPGGECYADVKRRALETLAGIAQVEGTAVLVTHAGVIRALLGAWLSLPDDAIFRIDQRYGSVNVVDWIDGGPVIRLLNGLPGLSPPP